MTKKQESEAGNDKPSRRGGTLGVKKNAAERSPAKSKKFVPTDDSIFKEFMTEKDLAIEWIQEYLPWLADLLNLNGLGGLQTVSLDHGGNLSESDRHIILVYGNHLTNLGLAGKTYRVTNLECALGR